MPNPTPSQWYKNQFLISTSQALLQHDVINAVFDSEYMYWTKRISDEAMKHMLSHSLSPLQPTPNTQLTDSGRTPPTQIGLARVITDESTFAYLTDVFIIPEYQGKGIGKWLMECINETLDSWPDLRGAILYTGGHDGERAMKFYEKVFGMKKFVPGTGGLEIMSKRGPGSVFDDI
ncbi:acetyltransferase [Hyaloscypha sp. PMI_1271]|nr:acetyltransferase [Hyaloscypha sp. PMI_1271]